MTTYRPRATVPYLLLLLLILPLQLGLLHQAQAARHPQPRLNDTAPPQAGVLLLTRSNTGAEPAPQLNSHADLQVNANLARVTLSQQFVNPGTHWAEALYQFPLPDQASVDRLRIQIDERIIEGVIQEKAKARATYAKARAEGKAAGLVEQQRHNLFSSKVANIPPGASIRIEISYLQPVTYNSGHYELLMPMTLTPRYIPGRALPRQPAADTLTGWAPATDQVPDASSITPPQIAGDGTTHRINITLSLNPGIPLAELTSPSHPLQVQRTQHRYRITPAAGPVAMDRDFVVRWTPAAGHQPNASVLVEPHHSATQPGPTQPGHNNAVDDQPAANPAGLHYALLQLLPPAPSQNVKKLSREQIFIIDTSGSMSGTSMEQARSALTQALHQLGGDDYFNIIEFNSHARALYSQPMRASAFNVSEALHFVDQLTANGGTEIAPALATAFTQPPSEADTSQVIFITDGSVGNETTLLTQIDRQRKKRRLFTIAIGSAPNHYFMRQAARIGQGSYTRIGDVSEVSSRMQELLYKLDTPRLSNIEIRWPPGNRNCATRAPDLFASEPLVLLCQLTGIEGDVEIKGRVGDRHWLQRVPLQPLQRQQPGIAKLWAAEQIQQLEDQQLGQHDTPLLRQRILKLALDYQLVSQYTSLVAVERTPIRPDAETLKRHRLANLTPAGSALSGFPQTATDSPLLLLSGTALVLLALLLGLAPRARRTATCA
ncbi:marine proteobacterial sortase target protein [Aestuariirhabdus sp. LZHN29]|uniref:marine proteobacterial sortase target protein n=1 Tax=Aestuariirhabdus sp. LZHN29 TaxID=3417462 RepID=UPI003CF390C7